MWGSGGRAPSILNLVTTKEVSGQLTAPGGFTTEESFRRIESVADSGGPITRLDILEKRRLLFVPGVETRSLGPPICKLFFVASSSNSFFVLGRVSFLKGFQNAELRIKWQRLLFFFFVTQSLFEAQFGM